MNNETWLAPEEHAYPNDTFTRKGRALVARNPHNPIILPYGEVRAVLAKCADSMSTVPAKLRYRGATVDGYLTYLSDPSLDSYGELVFIPEASPETCEHCTPSHGCKRYPLPPGAPNLDGEIDLAAWLESYPVGTHERLFGARTYAATALRILRRYARLTLRSRALRASGEIIPAERLESQCERLYQSLPTWGKW